MDGFLACVFFMRQKSRQKCLFLRPRAKDWMYRPAHIVQLVRVLDLKTRDCGFDSRAGHLTIINWLLDETLNRGPV